jgi:hypothetical protein
MTTNRKEVLKKKIALNKVVAFFEGVEGVSDIDFIEHERGDFDKYCEKIKKIFGYQREIKPTQEVCLKLIGDGVIKWQVECLSSIIGKEVFIDANEYYFVRFKIFDGMLFIKSICSLNGNNDLILFVKSPRKILVFSDDEYTISFYEEMI